MSHCKNAKLPVISKYPCSHNFQCGLIKKVSGALKQVQLLQHLFIMTFNLSNQNNSFIQDTAVSRLFTSFSHNRLIRSLNKHFNDLISLIAALIIQRSFTKQFYCKDIHILWLIRKTCSRMCSSSLVSPKGLPLTRVKSLFGLYRYLAVF